MKVTPVILMLFAVLIVGISAEHRMDAGGLLCAVCTVINGLVDQLSVVHTESRNAAFSRLCRILPNPYGAFCSAYKLLYGVRIVRLLDAGETADTACMDLGMCDAPAEGKQMCHLFPSKLAKQSSAEVVKHLEALKIQMPEKVAIPVVDKTNKIDICNIPLIGNLVCSLLDIQGFTISKPHDDDDGDGFGDQITLRGSAWRGKDCSDRNDNFYPGRRPDLNDVIADTNCNGIFGVDPITKIPYEQTFCENSGARGIIAFGDSVTANFHVPYQWLDASVTSEFWFTNMSFIMENSLNWPHTSFYTGYEDVDWPVIDGQTQSFYRKLRERNLCNHRDYQNLGVNGGTITDGPQQSTTMTRSSVKDKPAVVILSFIGNDVCKYEPNNPGSVTTPQQARESLLTTLREIDRKVAAQSHVVVVAVADARSLFNDMLNKIHPFGSVRSDVTYADFYGWMTCIDINPCQGWLTTNQTIQAITAQRVVDINNALEQTVNEYKTAFTNFELTYFPNPLTPVVDAWVAQGGQPWQLVEKFDGFHPNQRGHHLVGEAIWTMIERDYPYLIGPVNPYNAQIRQLFGNQGGH